MSTAGPGLPSYDEVLELPVAVKLSVPPEFEDRNGHMNIRHYFDVQAEAVASLFTRVDWFREFDGRQMGPFTMEQHLRYHRECHVGDQLSSHLRLVARTDKVVHGLALLVNHSTREVSCTLEFLLGNVDRDQRRIAAFPAPVAATLDELLAGHAALSWPVPELGAVGVRPR